MGLRCLMCLLLVQALYWGSEASSLRQRRQTDNSFPGQPSEPRAYQPPISLGGSPVPVASSASIQNSYQPPISLIRSNEYQSPLIPPQNPYPASAPRSYQPPQISSPQNYVLVNQPQHQSHSVQYIPPTNHQQSFSVFPQSSPNHVPQPATSYSVHQQPLHNSQGQSSFAILSDNSGLPQSTVERTYSTHSKVVGSAHVPVQSIHKTPASEIQPDKGSAAKEKADAKDEYIVYYYYYYDNDTSANNNLSLNFDDIPSLEGYDNDKLGKEPEKSASARTLSANINSLSPGQAKPEKDGSHPAETSSSQPRSVGDAYARPDRPNSNPLDDTVVQPLKPISNVFRYGSNEVPRFPVLPNFIVTEVPTTTKPELLTPDSLATEPPTTQPSQINAQPDLKIPEGEEDDDLNYVLDNRSDLKSNDDRTEEEPPTTTTTTTTEPPTTTEEPTTTTERSRRRPSIGGGRRRFNPSPSSSPSFSSSRNRQTPSRSTSSTSSTTTTTTASPTRRSFQGSRGRPRPPIGSNRPRPGSRITNADNEDKAESKAPEATTSSTTTTTTARSRFSSSAPRRFQSSRSRSQTSSTTSTTTRAPASAISSRSRPTSRPRPNLVTRNRPPRPGFLRPRPGSDPEEPETTTVAAPPTEEETSPETTDDELPSTNNESNETDEDNETSDEETEEPTTTESSRFSALFRPRNRNSLGNRPRPVIGNRPSRS